MSIRQNLTILLYCEFKILDFAIFFPYLTHYDIVDVIPWRQKQLLFLGHSSWYNLIISCTHLKFMSWNANSHLLWGNNNWPSSASLPPISTTTYWKIFIKLLLLIKWSFKWKDQINLFFIFFLFFLSFSSVLFFTNF